MPRLPTRVIEALSQTSMPDEHHRLCMLVFRHTFISDFDSCGLAAEFLDRNNVPEQAVQDLSGMGVIRRVGRGWAFQDPLAIPWKAYQQAEAKPKAPSDDYSAAFLAVRAVYPKRPGVSHSWTEAWRQYRTRVKEGVQENVMLQGARAYASYLASQVGQKPDAYDFVMAPSRFFGRDKHYEREWSATTQPGQVSMTWDAQQEDVSKPVFTEGIKRKK